MAPARTSSATSVTNLLRSVGIGGSGNDAPLPLYSPVTSTEPGNSQSDDDDDASHTTMMDDMENGQLYPAQRQAETTSLAPSTTSSFTRPTLARFLADFTLGFADGLTVPFALTAGLSSLGQTDTVIYAGMAEICAGSLSMGIGGYLSAKGERAAADTLDPEKTSAGASRSGKANLPTAAAEYLAPLELPPQLMELVAAHVKQRSDVLSSIENKMAKDDEEEGMRSPILAGLSVAVGYLLGGSLPLFPYFVVNRVGDGLWWSFVVCVIALFVFGFTKDFVLARQRTRRDEDEQWPRERSGVLWKEIRHSTWEGALMVFLGSVAAIAAVVCVRLFEGMQHAPPHP